MLQQVRNTCCLATSQTWASEVYILYAFIVLIPMRNPPSTRLHHPLRPQRPCHAQVLRSSLRPGYPVPARQRRLRRAGDGQHSPGFLPFGFKFGHEVDKIAGVILISPRTYSVCESLLSCWGEGFGAFQCRMSHIFTNTAHILIRIIYNSAHAYLQPA